MTARAFQCRGCSARSGEGKVMPPAFEEPVPTVERPVALVVEASFDSERFTIDTTTIEGQRVVVVQQKDGVRYLTAAETLALSRALLSRLAYVGFPTEAAGSDASMLDRVRIPKDADIRMSGDDL